MKIPKNLTQFFHLTQSGSFSQFWRDPIHIVSVFATFSFSPETFSKQSCNTNKARTECKSNKTTVVSSANLSSLVSKLFKFHSFNIVLHIAIARISTAVTKR